MSTYRYKFELVHPSGAHRSVARIREAAKSMDLSVEEFLKAAACSMADLILQSAEAAAATPEVADVQVPE